MARSGEQNQQVIIRAREIRIGVRLMALVAAGLFVALLLVTFMVEKERRGPLACAVVGAGGILIAIINQVLNFRHYGSVRIVGFGQVDRRRNPVGYWLVTVMLLSPLLALLVCGLYLSNR